MNRRVTRLAGAALLVLALGSGLSLAVAEEPPSSQPEETPPVPPAPPRLAEGPDYEHCLAMLADDPTGAYAFADAWDATGGGAPALHCRALAQIALGDPQAGAELLEKAVATSQAPAASRAAVLGEAVQAWLMADDPARGYDAASKALTLSPDDPDLLIDRSITAATMERYMDAIDDLDHALALDPERVDALVFRAAAWRNESRLPRAREDIDRAIALDPDNPEALLERGIERKLAGDTAGAREDWDRAKTLAADTATADLAEQNLALLDAGPVSR
ncbi:MAG: tetratricopeptide repeat protein [Alphaproteobacteria bacterium]|nr:tetratricopeptide repeat protein [Alphaproteobacteria bacterium]